VANAVDDLRELRGQRERLAQRLERRGHARDHMPAGQRVRVRIGRQARVVQLGADVGHLVGGQYVLWRAHDREQTQLIAQRYRPPGYLRVSRDDLVAQGHAARLVAHEDGVLEARRGHGHFLGSGRKHADAAGKPGGRNHRGRVRDDLGAVRRRRVERGGSEKRSRIRRRKRRA
jgi:hypothetical protein